MGGGTRVESEFSPGGKTCKGTHQCYPENKNNNKKKKKNRSITTPVPCMRC